MARVSVCVGTYLRPAELERLLTGLDGLAFCKVEAPQVEIVVVDNDPEQSARAVCEVMRDRVRWPVRYVWEERAGISHVRNRAVEAADPATEFIAYVDDDEVPEPAWLDELLAVQREHDADLVAGPVLPRFEEPAPAWILKGRFFDLPRYATGERIQHAGTGNVLIRAQLMREMDEPFDPRMALLGGEDTLFFLRLAAAGRRMVWADEAVIHEWIPASRTRAEWLVRRAFRKGNTWSLCERELHPSPATGLARVAKGLVRMGQGALLLPLGLVRGRHAVVEAARTAAVGAGNVVGVFGLRYQEYRTKVGP